MANVYESHITHYDTSDINIYDWLKNREAEYCYGNSETASTWCTFRGRANAATVTYYVKWGFDFSYIPQMAVIDSVSVSIKCYFYASSDKAWGGGQVQLCKGDYATGLVGTATSLAKRSSIETLTISAANSGTWTRADLDNLYLVTSGDITSYGISMSYNPQFRVYGATVRVEYHVDTNFKITTNITNGVLEPSESPLY